jgi:predicted enzyme related to lactoylglutathione lyase
VVHNLDRSQEFYSAIFGWRFMEPQPNFPRIFFTGGEVMGGLHPRSSSDTGDVAEEGQKDEAHRKQRVVNYILVDDVDEVLRKVKANGGIVVKDKFTEGNHSELAEFEFEGVVTGVLRWLNP